MLYCFVCISYVGVFTRTGAVDHERCWPLSKCRDDVQAPASGSI